MSYQKLRDKLEAVITAAGVTVAGHYAFCELESGQKLTAQMQDDGFTVSPAVIRFGTDGPYADGLIITFDKFEDGDVSGDPTGMRGINLTELYKANWVARSHMESYDDEGCIADRDVVELERE
jgi:hypothetical protein